MSERIRYQSTETSSGFKLERFSRIPHPVVDSLLPKLDDTEMALLADMLSPRVKKHY